jgi:hypothetical protein
MESERVLDGVPPRLAGYQAHLPPPADEPLDPEEPAELPGERTGEQAWLPDGTGPGERRGPALMGARDFDWPPRLEPTAEPEPESGPSPQRRHRD